MSKMKVTNGNGPKRTDLFKVIVSLSGGANVIGTSSSTVYNVMYSKLKTIVLDSI